MNQLHAYECKRNPGDSNKMEHIKSKRKIGERRGRVTINTWEKVHKIYSPLTPAFNTEICAYSHLVRRVPTLSPPLAPASIRRARPRLLLLFAYELSPTYIKSVDLRQGTQKHCFFPCVERPCRCVYFTNFASLRRKVRLGICGIFLYQVFIKRSVLVI